MVEIISCLYICLLESGCCRIKLKSKGNYIGEMNSDYPIVTVYGNVVVF